MNVPELSRHARERMSQRHIAEDDIASALARRTGREEPGDGGNTCIYGYASSGRILKVVLTADRARVVTLMWQS